MTVKEMAEPSVEESPESITETPIAENEGKNKEIVKEKIVPAVTTSSESPTTVPTPVRPVEETTIKEETATPEDDTMTIKVEEDLADVEETEGSVPRATTMTPTSSEDPSSSPDASVLLLMEDNAPRMLTSDDSDELVPENDEMVAMSTEEPTVKDLTPPQATETQLESDAKQVEPAKETPFKEPATSPSDELAPGKTDLTSETTTDEASVAISLTEAIDRPMPVEATEEESSVIQQVRAEDKSDVTSAKEAVEEEAITEAQVETATELTVSLPTQDQTATGIVSASNDASDKTILAEAIEDSIADKTAVETSSDEATPYEDESSVQTVKTNLEIPTDSAKSSEPSTTYPTTVIEVSPLPVEPAKDSSMAQASAATVLTTAEENLESATTPAEVPRTSETVVDTTAAMMHSVETKTREDIVEDIFANPEEENEDDDYYYYEDDAQLVP